MCPAPREDDMTTIDRVAAAVLAVLLFGGVGAAQAQQPSLADVARQTAEARKAKEKAAKTYTNEDLKGGRPVTVARSGADRPASPEDKAAVAAADPAAKRIEELKAYVAQRRQESERLERRIGELNDAVLNTFSEQQRQTMVRERDAAIDEFRKVQIDIAAQSKAAADLEAEAAKAPPSPQKPQ